MLCHRCGKIVDEGVRVCPGCGLEFPVKKPVARMSPCPPLPEVSMPAGPEYAGFWRRVIAFFLDKFLLAIVNLALCMIYMLVVGFEWGEGELSLLTLASAIFGFFMRWLYFTMLESSSLQATFGKAAIGIVVTDMAGNRISLGRANARYWAKIISSLTLGFGYLMAGFTKRKQALHDLIAETLVIRKQ